MQQNEYAGSGDLHVSREVIADIAAAAAGEAEGVAGLSSRQMQRSGNAPAHTGFAKPVRIEFKSGEVTADIYANFFLGAKIPETSGRIQEKVKDSIQNMTGIPVRKVNVHVSGLVIPEKGEE